MKTSDQLHDQLQAVIDGWNTPTPDDKPTGKRKSKPVQTSLFDDAAVDDWGDSAELRRTNAGMNRLL